MSEFESEHTPEAIDDDQLPDDLQPGEDNPLAEGLDNEEAEDADLDLLETGKDADEMDSDDGEESSESGDADSSDQT